jgi:hypothetical protein
MAQVSQKAQQELRKLLELATRLVSELVECERTSSAAVAPSPAIVFVVVDTLALGAEAFQASNKDIDYWNDGFEGILYSLCREVINSLALIKEGPQHKLLLELKEVTTAIDVWHTKHIAA